MKKIWEFINSKLGLLLLAFVLTTVVGSYLVQIFQRTSRLQELRFTHLHEKRVQAIKDLVEWNVKVENSLLNWYYTYRPIGITPPKVKAEDVVIQVRDFRMLFEKNRIYFSSELCDIVDSLCNKFEEASIVLQNAELLSGDPAFRSPPFEETPFLQIQDQAKAVRERLEEEFRKLLGVK